METASISSRARFFLDPSGEAYILAIVNSTYGEAAFINVNTGVVFGRFFASSMTNDNIPENWQELHNLTAEVSYDTADRNRPQSSNSTTVRIGDYEARVSREGVDVAGIHVSMDAAQELVNAISQVRN